MKTFCGFIGLFVGMFLGITVANTAPFLSFIFVMGGMPLGQYIGKSIEESRENEQRSREEFERHRIQEEYARQKKIQKRNEVIFLSRKYPEATKQYFKQHWGITKACILDSDITDDKVDVLLGHKYSYERDEESLNASYRAKKEAERLAQKRRDDARREAERQAEILRRQIEDREKRALISKVSNWHMLSGGLHFNYLFNYYPTTCSFEANETEWNNRWTVWNFKNTPGKTSSWDHRKALDNVIPRIQIMLENSFGKEGLKYLTLVCIPASNQTNNEARYKEFSDRLCRETGMTNSYDRITVTHEKQERRSGGTSIGMSNLSLDESFFKDRYILLFDDVITRGDSMRTFKSKMESLGAHVVAGLCIGLTTHER